jgi:hypothetical protein
LVAYKKGGGVQGLIEEGAEGEGAEGATEESSIIIHKG